MRVRRASRDVRDAVDLDAQPVAGKRRDLNGRTGRAVVAEHPLVHGVHCHELRHVDEEDAAAQHMLQVAAGGLQDRLDVPEALLCLLGGVAGDRARRRILSALTGDEDETFEAHARRVGADGLRKVGGVHGAVCHGDRGNDRREELRTSEYPDRLLLLPERPVLAAGVAVRLPLHQEATTIMSRNVIRGTGYRECPPALHSG